jgi:hypothetical protein
MRWADLELVVVRHLRASLPGVRVMTSAPSDLEAQMPAVRVMRGPGSDDGVTDEPLIDVDAFAANAGAMWDLAEDVREAMHALAGRVVDGRLVDWVRTATAPTAVDWGNPKIHRAVASYRVAQRKT